MTLLFYVFIAHLCGKTLDIFHLRPMLDGEAATLANEKLSFIAGECLTQNNTYYMER